LLQIFNVRGTPLANRKFGSRFGPNDLGPGDSFSCTRYSVQYNGVQGTNKANDYCII
jgi:hypothetical protein